MTQCTLKTGQFSGFELLVYRSSCLALGRRKLSITVLINQVIANVLRRITEAHRNYQQRTQKSILENNLKALEQLKWGDGAQRKLNISVVPVIQKF